MESYIVQLAFSAAFGRVSYGVGNFHRKLKSIGVGHCRSLTDISKDNSSYDFSYTYNMLSHLSTSGD